MCGNKDTQYMGIILCFKLVYRRGVKGGRTGIKETKKKIYSPEDRFPRWAVG